MLRRRGKKSQLKMRFMIAAIAVWTSLTGTHAYAVEPLSANALPKELLAACDAEARAFAWTEDKITDAITTLIQRRVFSADDFNGVKLGFCELRDSGGPAATTSCADNIILFDRSYAGRNQELALVLTMAHEMKHVRQHRRAKAAYGDDYCASARYERDKPALEENADKFGDAIADLFFGQSATPDAKG